MANPFRWPGVRHRARFAQKTSTGEPSLPKGEGRPARHSRTSGGGGEGKGAIKRPASRKRTTAESHFLRRANYDPPASFPNKRIPVKGQPVICLAVGLGTPQLR